MALEIKGLEAEIDGEKAVKDASITVEKGEIHALMGPNGSGKSTLCKTVMNHPEVQKLSGTISIDGESLQGLETSERAEKGLFHGFQYPVEIPGITVEEFLWEAVNAQEDISREEFDERMEEGLETLGIDPEYRNRFLNDGFSGGEKKKNELLQLAVLQPRYALLDEIDSGLDVDALEEVAEAIKKLSEDTGLLVVTHYSRLPELVEVDRVHVMKNGKTVADGGPGLVRDIEESGYETV